MSRAPFSRRAFLRGAGATLALPFLESLLPRSARAAMMPPKRLLAFYVPCGINMKQWRPAATGPGYALSPILAPLAPVKSKVLVISGLANRPAQPDGPGDHASGTGAFLTAMHPFKTDGANIMNGISVDQVAANAIGGKTPFPSLQLGTEGGSSAGGCDSGYSCAYARNISWAGPAQPLPKLVNPQVIFDRLFGGFDPKESAAEAKKRLAYKKSVLDGLTVDVASLRARLGQTDRRKLDEYAGGVRALEKRIADSASAPVCDPGTRPTDNPDIEKLVAQMIDLMVIAFQCDLTRVISFMLGNAGSNQSYPFIGVAGAHHELSHHQDDPVKLGQLATIDTWEVKQLATLLTRLDAITEMDGQSVLDHSAVFFSGEISDGNAHNHTDMPVLLCGRAGGALSQTGQHVVLPREEPFANLFTSLLRALDVPNDRFGMNGTGPLSILA